MLQKQGVEISRATAPFTVTVPGKKRRRAGSTTNDAAGAAASAAGRRRRRAARSIGQDAGATPQEPRRAGDAHVPGRPLHRAHGPAVQPHRRRAARLSVLGARRSAAEPVRRHRLDVPRALQRAGRARHRREGARRADGAGQGRGDGAGRRRAAPAAVFAINHNADNALATLRYRFKDAEIEVAEEPFEAGGQKFNRGSFIIQQRQRRRPRQGRDGARPQGRRARGGADR